MRLSALVINRRNFCGSAIRPVVSRDKRQQDRQIHEEHRHFLSLRSNTASRSWTPVLLLTLVVKRWLKVVKKECHSLDDHKLHNCNLDNQYMTKNLGRTPLRAWITCRGCGEWVQVQHHGRTLLEILTEMNLEAHIWAWFFFRKVL